MGDSKFAPREVISISINLENNKKLILNNIYRSPHSTVEDNRNINHVFRSFGQLKHDHQVILGDFNRKSIGWVTAMSVSDDDCEFLEATRDSFLTHHVLPPTKEPSLIDLVFTSNEESIESINMRAPLGSDHSFIKILFRCQPEKQVDKLVCNYVKADFKKMNEKLEIGILSSKIVRMMLTLHGKCFCKNTTKLSGNIYLGKLLKQVGKDLAYLLTGKP